MLSQVDLISEADYNIEHINSSVCFEIYPTVRPAITKTDLFVGLAKKQEPYFIFSVGHLIAASCKLAVNIFCRGIFNKSTIKHIFDDINSIWKEALGHFLTLQLLMEIRKLISSFI